MRSNLPTTKLLAGPHTALRAELLADLDAQLVRLARELETPQPVGEGRDPSRWWWTDEDGIVLLKIFFRGSPLFVREEADTALLTGLDEVRQVLRSVRAAVVSGKLDEQLGARKFR